MARRARGLAVDKEECPDCQDRVNTLWYIAVEDGRQELDPEWETRCRRHRDTSGEPE